MDIAQLIKLLMYVVPAVAGVGTYFMKKLLDRIDVLESQLPERVTSSQVRQIISDRIDPIKEDLAYIKTAIGKLSDQIYDMNRNKKDE